METILQHWIATRFVYPFFLVFFIVFAILEKTKILGENKQVNSLVAFVIGLIFVSVAYPVDVVGNLILFLTVAIIIMFVGLLLWGFASGGEAKFSGGWAKVIGGVIAVAVVLAVLWATGVSGGVFDLLFYQPWSGTLWTNVAFIVVVIVALGIAMKSGK